MQENALSVRRQCQLLSLTRSTLYYSRQPENQQNLSIMEAIDQQYTVDPCYGVLRMTEHLRRMDCFGDINPKRVRRLMRLMNLVAIYQKPNTSKLNPAHTVYPYLLRNVPVERANQVWATDITYIPMRHGFAYLVAILDWYSRYVLSWRISTSLDSCFCLEALDEALERFEAPEISNTDQETQFTSKPWIERLQANGVKISMDGKGRYRDNIIVERLWRTVKYEDVYLKRYESVGELKAGLDAYFQYYNESRLHQGLGYRTPQEVYFQSVGKPFKTLTGLEPLSNTNNDDEFLILDPSVA
jgi:putative transposase